MSDKTVMLFSKAGNIVSKRCSRFREYSQITFPFVLKTLSGFWRSSLTGLFAVWSGIAYNKYCDIRDWTGFLIRGLRCRQILITIDKDACFPAKAFRIIIWSDWSLGGSVPSTIVALMPYKHLNVLFSYSGAIGGLVWSKVTYKVMVDFA